MRSKIKSALSLSGIVKAERLKGRKVVFTNGCFDILHVGHVTYLEKAASMGDIFIVGINSDRSVKELKGNDRPINNQKDRAKVLSSLYFIDYVTIFNELTPEKLIKSLSPDVIVKGGDWKESDIIGADFVKSYGGKVERVPFVKGYSTSSTIKKMAKH